MKRVLTCIAILLAALFLGSGCSTTASSGGQKKTASQPPEVVSPAVAAPQ
jgi:PBP1b-binding outer membrane lipoprotein LpoB